MEPEGSSQHSQAPATCPYPEPAQSSPHTLIHVASIYRSQMFRKLPVFRTGVYTASVMSYFTGVPSPLCVKTIRWGKFSQKHNYKCMAKWWCLLAMENYMFRPIAAIIRFWQLSRFIYNMHKPHGDVEISSSPRGFCTLCITLVARKFSEPEDGRYRPKHVVFHC